MAVAGRLSPAVARPHQSQRKHSRSAGAAPSGRGSLDSATSGPSSVRRAPGVRSALLGVQNAGFAGPSHGSSRTQNNPAAAGGEITEEPGSSADDESLGQAWRSAARYGCSIPKHRTRKTQTVSPLKTHLIASLHPDPHHPLTDRNNHGCMADPHPQQHTQQSPRKIRRRAGYGVPRSC